MLQFRKCTERKHRAKADLERNVVLHCASEVDALDITLHVAVRDQVDAITLRRLNADYEEAEEESQGFGKYRNTEASDETCMERKINQSEREFWETDVVLFLRGFSLTDYASRAQLAYRASIEPAAP